VQRASVNPRSRQKISVKTLAGADLSMVVTFPNGDKKTNDNTASASGRTSWSFVQPGSRITHSSRTASVSVTVTLGAATRVGHKKYTIGFAAIDLSVQPRSAKRGQQISAWVHSSAYEHVTVALIFKGNLVANLRGLTGRDGWVGLPATVPAQAPKGKVDVKGVGTAGTTVVRGETSFKVK
jgi:hypothetical protein